MAEISREDCFVTVDGMEINEVPDGYVIYDKVSDHVHYLNPTAAIIYQMSDGNRTVGDITEFMKSAFEACKEADVHLSIEDMIKAGLISKSPQ